MIPVYTRAGTVLVPGNILRDSWYPLVQFHTSDGTALVPRKITACLGIVTPSLQFWPAFTRSLLETDVCGGGVGGGGGDSRLSHLTRNALN